MTFLRRIGLLLALLLCAQLAFASSFTRNLQTGFQAGDLPHVQAVTISGSPTLGVYHITFLADGIDSSGTTTVTPSGVFTTWTQVAKITQSAALVHYVFVGTGTATTGNITTTVSGGGFAEAFAIGTTLDTATGTHATTPIVQTSSLGSGNSASPATTLSAFANGSNATYHTILTDGAAFDTATDGFTSLGSANMVGDAHVGTQWKATNDTSPTAALTGIGGPWQAYSFEIAEAAGGGSSPVLKILLQH
jgi:hypothetical protein